MKLEFNDLSELDAFLDWSLRYGAAWAATQRGPSASAPDTSGVAFDTPPVGAALLDKDAVEALHREVAAKVPGTDVAPESSATPDAGKPARKRRTKAEIEADEKAAAAAQAEQQAAKAAVHAAAHEPAAGQAQQAAAEAAKQPEGTNPFATAETPAGEAASTPPADAQGEDAGEAVVTPFQHLTRAREFIAKHGMPKYNETFAKAGLDANVMAYSAYQRAVHVAALDEMDKA